MSAHTSTLYLRICSTIEQEQARIEATIDAMPVMSRAALFQRLGNADLIRVATAEELRLVGDLAQLEMLRDMRERLLSRTEVHHE